MFARSLAPRPLAAERPPWLRGTLLVPGDPIVSHLTLCAATLARGESVIEAVPETAGIMATAAALGELGARIERHEGRWHVAGLGAGGLLEPRAVLDFEAEALGVELAMGLCAPYDFPSRFTGDPELSARSFGPLLERLAAFGTAVTGDDRGRLPITLHGPPVAMPVELDLPRAAPATKAALLLAALGAPGVTTFVEPTPGWDHAERVLASFGGRITVENRDDGSRLVTVGGLPDLVARRVAIAGDPLAASLGLLAASIVPASELRLERILVNPARTGFFSALVAMGAAIEVHDLEVVAREEVADLVVRHAGLRGITLATGFVESILSYLPLLAVAAACAEGETVLHLPARLPLEDRARIAAVARGLRANGVACEDGEEALVIVGTGQVPGGGEVATGGDPEVAMAFLVLGMAADNPVAIDDGTGIDERVPGFVDAFEQVGASFVR